MNSIPESTLSAIENDADVTRDRQKRGRRMIALIAAICLMPLAAAVFFRFVSPPGPGSLAGEPLSPPVHFPFSGIQDAEGQPLIQTEVSTQWTIVFASGAECAKTCQELLYLTRQARTAQGRNMERLHRLWVVTDQGKPDSEFLAQHPDLKVVRPTNAGAIAPYLSTPGREVFYLIDRRGFAVFRYPATTDPKTFIKELGKLVKF